MLGEQIENELSSVAEAVELFIDKALSEEGQEDALDKVSHFLDVANQLIDYIEPGSNEEGAESENNHNNNKNYTDNNKRYNGKSVIQTIQLVIQAAFSNPDLLAKHYCEFATSILDILNNQSGFQPEPTDRRFKDELWHKSIFLSSLMKIYLAWNHHILSWIEEQQFSEQDEKRVKFILNQLVAALSPSNLPINPLAIKRAENTEGRSAVKGLLNWIKDCCYNQSMPSQIRKDAYTVGKNLALTPGQVVFKNNLLELIQYEPQTQKVHRRPILLIPPQINKYYIFDLKNKNSVLGYLVKQELQMFVVSWRNPTKQDADIGLDDYILALLDALDVMQNITRSKSAGIISACAGGLTASALLAYLAEIKNTRVKNHTSLVTALTPNNDSVLELFTTDKTIALARSHTKIEGLMDGKALARVFAWLRPEELVWNYWVNNYLMGRDPPPLDVLFWDNDSTKLPSRLHADFLDMYENNVFMTPYSQKILAKPVNYKKIKVDTYITAGVEDYLMPWRGVYKSTQIFRGKHRFILSTSGHVQSVLRPPTLAHTEYYINDAFPENPDDWFSSASCKKGSWWIDWTEWLKSHSGALKKSPAALGSSDYPPLYSAPGEYVHEKSS